MRWLFFHFINLILKAWHINVMVLLLMMNTGFFSKIIAQPVLSNDTFSSIDIQAHIHNAERAFEAALYTPATPAPGQSGGETWQMNPSGAPVWNTNGNMYGDTHSFLFTYTKATGTSVWNVDFNRDGDYADPEETVTNSAPTLVGKGLTYINVWGQGSASGYTASLFDLVVNGVPFGDYSSSSESPFSVLFEETSGLFNDISVSGNFSFSGNGDQNRPRIRVRLGTPNDAPECSITNPSSGAQYSVADTIHIDAIADDTDGYVALVEFYANNIKIGEDSISPYQYAWDGVTSGAYLLTVKAVDLLGATMVSSPVDIVVLSNVAPTCVISNPVDGFIYYDPDTIVIEVIAEDPNDSVSVVTFFVDAIYIGEDLQIPFQNTSLVNPPMGIYTFSASSTDSFGATTFSLPVNITVRCIREDLDFNGIVNTNDYLMLLSAFGVICTGCNEDFSGDGAVNTIDFLRLLTKMGYSCN